MSVEITTPQLGESIVEATVGRWRKAQGDAVTAGEPLVELETDKVNIEVTSPSDGVLANIRKQEGETVGVGETLAEVSAEQPAEQPTAATPAPAAKPAPATAAASNGAGGRWRRRASSRASRRASSRAGGWRPCDATGAAGRG